MRVCAELQMNVDDRLLKAIALNLTSDTAHVAAGDSARDRGPPPTVPATLVPQSVGRSRRVGDSATRMGAVCCP